MASSVKVRNLIIGEGTPKICVPVTGVTKNDIITEARIVTGLPADLAEWRADWYADIGVPGRPEDILEELRAILGDMPLITTVRTSGEGGRLSIDPHDYSELVIRAVKTGCTDIVDTEAFIDSNGAVASRIIETAHRSAVKVIASFHDFEGTPGKDELVYRMRRMQDLGADIIKIAVMPHSEADVSTLISAAAEMSSQYADRPLVAISMGDQGLVTRINCASWGSSMTFAAATRASAPGQISAAKLKELITAPAK